MTNVRLVTFSIEYNSTEYNAMVGVVWAPNGAMSARYCEADTVGAARGLLSRDDLFRKLEELHAVKMRASAAKDLIDMIEITEKPHAAD